MAFKAHFPIVLLIACTSAPTRDRRAERAACELISASGGELARCLVMKYDWPAESAGEAKYSWQRHLDSLRQAHEDEVASLIAQQDAARAIVNAKQDSVRRAATRVRLDRMARRAAPWAECMLEEQRTEGTNWSYKACAQPLPTEAEVKAYIAVHRLGESEGSEGFDLLRAHFYRAEDAREKGATPDGPPPTADAIRRSD